VKQVPALLRHIVHAHIVKKQYWKAQRYRAKRQQMSHHTMFQFIKSLRLNPCFEYKKRNMNIKKMMRTL
jgi:hypothetical protein